MVKLLLVIKVGYLFVFFVYGLMDLLVVRWIGCGLLDKVIGLSDLVWCFYSFYFCMIYLYVFMYMVMVGWVLGRDVVFCKFLCF